MQLVTAYIDGNQILAEIGSFHGRRKARLAVHPPKVVGRHGSYLRNASLEMLLWLMRVYHSGVIHTPIHSVHRAQAETTNKLIDEIWRRHRITVLTRVDLLESVATAIVGRSLTLSLLEEALSASHKLAGSLGTFGFDEGTQLARELEQQLASAMPDAVAIRDSVRQLRLVLFGDKSDRLVTSN